MIYEKFPELESLDHEGRLILARELFDQAIAEIAHDETLPEEAITIIEQKVAAFLQDPKSGISREELKKKQGSAKGR